MTSLELIRSKQRMDKAAKDHAKAVKQQMDEEDAAKFAPLKKIYDEVKHLPAKPRHGCVYGTKPTIEDMWEDDATPRQISFWSWYGNSGWSLWIEGGKIHNNKGDGDNRKTTEDIEEAKGWLVEKLAEILEDQK